ncbi:hypothetical protein RN001_007226 [Aquatica leii]|uniref:Major facilitator superfamily (MFS) profile domain-containing protein n=1 Tax=Aquatica leii TaxID=1421715 RepID=A0AAN7Q464_9COLE|nr:hypothetical protein RN001_007226 [Aquatica leii]
MFGSAGSFITGFVLAMELVAPSKRTVCGITLQTAFAVGIILVAMWAAVIHDRQMLQLVYGLHGILLVGHWWWMDESPRWLWSNGKVTEAVSVVQKGLKINGSSVQLDTSYYLGANKINKYTPAVNMCYLYRLPILRKRILNVCLAWFANSLVYYGLSFGDCGKYQLMQLVLHLIATITSGMHTLSLQTVGAVPNHRCRVPDLDTSANSSFTVVALEMYIPKLETEKFDSCYMYNLTANDNSTIPCNSWVYDSTYYKSSRGIEWNFVCNQRWMGAVAHSSFMFGSFIGAVTLGTAADKYGRKPIFCLSATLQLIFGVVAAFVSEYYQFLVVQFLYGLFGSAGCFIIGFVLSMELFGPSKRTACGIGFQAAFALGIILVAGWGAIIHNRQILQLIYGLHGIFLVGHWWWMDESPRWLWANGKVAEAVRVIQKGLKINGSSVLLDPVDYLATTTKVSKNVPSANIFDLFKTPIFRKRTLIVCFAWFANSLLFYGLSLSTGKLYGNPFVLLCLIGVVEIPGCILILLMMKCTGRRSSTSLFMVVASICCIIATYLLKNNVGSTIFVMISKFSISNSFTILSNYTAELFPTAVRNSVLGLGATSARLSATLIPLITLLDSLNLALPTTIFATIAIISAFLVLFLPETLGSSMPQTLEDGRTFRVNDTAFTLCCKKQKTKTLLKPNKVTLDLV